MKRRFCKILGVGLTLALLTSLLLTAAPVSALSNPTVTVTPTTISATANWTAMFTVAQPLAADTGTITVTFPVGAGITSIDDAAITNATGTATFTNAEIDVAGTGTAFTAAMVGKKIEVGNSGNWYTIASFTDATNITISPAFAETTTTATIVIADVLVAAGPGIGTDAFQATEADSVTVGQALTITVPASIGTAAMVQVQVAGVVNPDTVGDYTLTVATSTEPVAVTSSVISITAPVIPGLPGVVKWYNTAGVLMGSYTAPEAINHAIGKSVAGYTIEVGPGTYVITINDELEITQAGLTLKSTAGAATTIIDATEVGIGISVAANDVTVDGFTVKDATACGISVNSSAEGATVQNNIVTQKDPWKQGITLEGGATKATVSGNELDINSTMYLSSGVSDCTLSDNTFGAGINLEGNNDSITITGNTIIGAEFEGISFNPPETGDYGYSNILIEGNTISETTETNVAGIYVRVQGSGTVTKLQIIGNDITDNEGDGIRIEAGAWGVTNVIKFNTITGNDTSTGDYGIQNDSDDDVDATLNWWGTTVAADIAAMVSGTDKGTVDYDPFLVDTAEAVFSATKVATGATLDASTTVGVAVSGATATSVIAVAKYIANPQEALADALAFYDVYATGVDDGATITIKLYGAVTENTEVYVWSALQGQWVKCVPTVAGAAATQGVNTFSGFCWVSVTTATIPAITDLAGTPFALVQPPVEEEVMAAPNVIALAQAATDVPLTPTFVWDPVAGATAYELQVARYPNFAGLVIDKTLESGALLEVPFFVSDVELDYSTTYYWRVRAVSVQDWVSEYIDQGAWVTRVFTTIAEPEAVVYTCPQCGLSFDTEAALETHVDEAHPPAAPAVTPSYIWVIIAVGAVLALAVIILIVRTRRVA